MVMQIKSWSAALLLTGLFIAPLSAQNIDPKLANALQHTLDSMRSVLNVKSLGAALHLPDGNTWAGANGISSVAPLDSVTPEHTYAIGSVTKTLTSACVLQLAEEGVLSLNDSLHQWLDTFQYINPNITIRQLLRHQSGIYDILGNSAFQPFMLQNYSELYSPEFGIKTFGKPSVFQAGSAWSYCNTNYMLLAMIIEKATGKPYYTEIQKRFLIPLGLNSVTLPPFEPLPEKIAHLWLDINGDGIRDDAHDFFSNWNSMFSVIYPSGSYFATPRDMAIWINALMGSDSIIGPATKTQMLTTVNTNLQANTKYGLGIMERNFGSYKAYGHGGDLSYSALVYYFPTEKVSISVLTNDSKNISWTLAPVVSALLKTYVDCKAMMTNTTAAALPESAVSVFPNPFTDKLQVKIELPNSVESLTLALSDLQGKTILMEQYKAVGSGAQAFELALPGASPAGSYLLQVMVDGQLVVAKTVVRS